LCCWQVFPPWRSAAASCRDGGGRFRDRLLRVWGEGGAATRGITAETGAAIDISDERVQNVSDKLAEGDVVRVKAPEVDKQGRIQLSMKGLEG
jgi:polyribonucleotide nucleotidyltransferase